MCDVALDEGLVRGDDGAVRCWWAGDDPLYRRYHGTEWGRPVADDVRLFEKLCLEGFMSGLSWLTILRKRENFRAAFAGFDPATVAEYGPPEVERLLGDAGIVRHRGKIEATITNARRYAELVAETGTLAAYLWSYEPSRSERRLDYPTLLSRSTTPESVAMSKDLRRRGWAFIGPTTVYSTMQAAGVVNDHLTGCSVRATIERERRAFSRPPPG
jgi:DNA-3-methyladenine glycosylase I